MSVNTSMLKLCKELRKAVGGASYLTEGMALLHKLDEAIEFLEPQGTVVPGVQICNIQEVCDCPCGGKILYYKEEEKFSCKNCHDCWSRDYISCVHTRTHQEVELEMWCFLFPGSAAKTGPHASRRVVCDCKRGHFIRASAGNSEKAESYHMCHDSECACVKAGMGSSSKNEAYTPPVDWESRWKETSARLWEVNQQLMVSDKSLELTQTTLKDAKAECECLGDSCRVLQSNVVRLNNNLEAVRKEVTRLEDILKSLAKALYLDTHPSDTDIEQKFLTRIQNYVKGAEAAQHLTGIEELKRSKDSTLASFVLYMESICKELNCISYKTWEEIYKEIMVKIKTLKVQSLPTEQDKDMELVADSRQRQLEEALKKLNEISAVIQKGKL